MNKTLERMLIGASGLVVGAGIATYVLIGQNKTPVSENAKVESVYFSPDKECSEHLIELIRSARKRVYVEAYTFTDKRIADAIISASKNGVDTRVLFDERQASIKSSLDEYLKENGIKVKLYDSKGIMHNKVIIVDSETVETGSFNYTRSADEKNEENIIVIKDKETAEKYEEEFGRLWGQ